MDLTDQDKLYLAKLQQETGCQVMVAVMGGDQQAANDALNWADTQPNFYSTPSSAYSPAPDVKAAADKAVADCQAAKKGHQDPHDQGKHKHKNK